MTRAVNTALAGAGGVLQVVSVTSNTQQTINTTSFTEIAGLTLSITPSSTNSKVLVIGVVRFTSTTNGAIAVAHFKLRRDSIDIGNGTGATGNMVNAHASAMDSDNDTPDASVPIQFLDSPSTTSTISYKVMAANTLQPISINYPSGPDNQFYNGFVTSSLTLMEIAG